MTGIAQKTRILEGIAPAAIPYDELMAAQSPVILKGLARHWPLVQAGLVSAQVAMDYLKGVYEGRPVTVYEGAPDIGGRFFYNEAFTGLNFSAARARLDEVLDRIAVLMDDPAPPALYIGSTDIDQYLPGLRTDNEIVFNHPMFAAHPPLRSIWIGNRTLATCHYDMSHNIAVCVAGRRRFTLFPPDQVASLYPGPLEPTPGGQVVSLVDFRHPDYARFPRFRDAEAAGQVAEMEPGDVLFYPALWWHHVEALEPFNILMNYWWNTSAAFMDTPQNTLLHAILSLRDRPQAEKDAWKALFDYYVFGPADRSGAHVPETLRGVLGPLDEMSARRLRAQLLQRFNR